MAHKYNDGFKREAVRISLSSRLTHRQVASDLGIHCTASDACIAESGFSTLAKWVQKSNPDDFPPASDIDLAKNNERLRKENCLLVEEREILN